MEERNHGKTERGGRGSMISASAAVLSALVVRWQPLGLDRAGMSGWFGGCLGGLGCRIGSGACSRASQRRIGNKRRLHHVQHQTLIMITRS